LTSGHNVDPITPNRKREICVASCSLANKVRIEYTGIQHTSVARTTTVYTFFSLVLDSVKTGSVGRVARNARATAINTFFGVVLLSIVAGFLARDDASANENAKC
jgi:hypothetical protein